MRWHAQPRQGILVIVAIVIVIAVLGLFLGVASPLGVHADAAASAAGSARRPQAARTTEPNPRARTAVTAVRASAINGIHHRAKSSILNGK